MLTQVRRVIRLAVSLNRFTDVRLSRYGIGIDRAASTRRTPGRPLIENRMGGLRSYVVRVSNTACGTMIPGRLATNASS